jgi:hypothetical protein
MRKDDWISKLYFKNILDNKGILSPEDYTIENGLMVFTEIYHKNNCKNCPYKK